MKKTHFVKMHGAGNDFILVDDREGHFPSHDHLRIAALAARRTGIACEGVILVQRSAAADFLVYGHLEDELRPLDPVPTVKLAWYSPQKSKPGKAPLPPEMVDWAAVVGAVWRDVDDTRRAVFAANISSERQTVRFRMPSGYGAPQVFPLPDQPPPDLAVADDVVTLTLAPTSFVGVTAPRH